MLCDKLQRVKEDEEKLEKVASSLRNIDVSLLVFHTSMLIFKTF